MTPREAFKMGFARRCEEEGLTPEQIAARVEKAAAYLEKKAFFNAMMDKIGPVVAQHPVEFGLAAPVALGAAGGWAAHHLGKQDIDEEDVRKRELISELQQWTRRAREQQKNKTMRLAPV